MKSYARLLVKITGIYCFQKVFSSPDQKVGLTKNIGNSFQNWCSQTDFLDRIIQSQTLHHHYTVLKIFWSIECLHVSNLIQKYLVVIQILDIAQTTYTLKLMLIRCEHLTKQVCANGGELLLRLSWKFPRKVHKATNLQTKKGTFPQKGHKKTHQHPLILFWYNQIIQLIFHLHPQ